MLSRTDKLLICVRQPVFLQVITIVSIQQSQDYVPHHWRGTDNQINSSKRRLGNELPKLTEAEWVFGYCASEINSKQTHIGNVTESNLVTTSPSFKRRGSLKSERHVR